MNYQTPLALLATAIAVNHNIPIPPAQPLFQRKYPFNVMSVGDSFFVPGITRQQIAGPIRYATCECRKYTSRRVVENGVLGLRVWRIA